MVENNQSNQKWIYSIVGIVFVVIALVLIALFLMQGNKKIVGNGGDVEASESMTCESKGMIYPLFKYDNAKDKLVKINIVFNDGKLDTINLIAKLYYDNEEQIEQSSAENHAALNISYYADEMGSDSFNALFSNLDDAMQMTLYAHAKDLNGMNAKYFLIESVGGYTKEMLKNNYNNQGLSCVIKEKE